MRILFKRPRGFTLIELVVVMAVLAIIAGMATPSFMDMIRDNRILLKQITLLVRYN